MPVAFRYKVFRFFFYSNEGNPREPLHIHVRSAEGEAKFRLTPLTFIWRSVMALTHAPCVSCKGS